MERPILIVKPSKIGCSTLRPKISPLIDDDKDMPIAHPPPIAVLPVPVTVPVYPNDYLIFLAIRKMRVIEALQKLEKRRGRIYSLFFWGNRTNDELELQSNLVHRSRL
jgi:hypothetical protein